MINERGSREGRGKPRIAVTWEPGLWEGPPLNRASGPPAGGTDSPLLPAYLHPEVRQPNAYKIMLVPLASDAVSSTEQKLDTWTYRRVCNLRVRCIVGLEGQEGSGNSHGPPMLACPGLL